MSIRRDDVRRLVHEHLNASMLMVALDEPLEPGIPISEALAYLDENGFDLALLRSPEVRIVYRDQLAQVDERNRGNPVKSKARNPRADRLIEHSLELGEVARRLREDAVPLLVIGRTGPQFIVTRADFTRPAGQAGVLAVLVALDAQLDELLRDFDEEAWNKLSAQRQKAIEVHVERARKRSEEMYRLSYLTLGERFEVVRQLELSGRLALGLGTQSEHELVTAVRNEIAHGREVRGGVEVIRALEVAERILDAIADRGRAGMTGSEPS